MNPNLETQAYDLSRRNIYYINESTQYWSMPSALVLEPPIFKIPFNEETETLVLGVNSSNYSIPESNNEIVRTLVNIAESLQELENFNEKVLFLEKIEDFLFRNKEIIEENYGALLLDILKSL